MIVIRTYKQNAEKFAGLISAVTFGSLKKMLRLYFKNIGQVKAMLYAEKKIELPFLTLERDRRVRDIPVQINRRKCQKETVLK